MTIRIEIDGRAATAEQLAVAALAHYGHFTAMQVRGGAVRGLDLHLARLTGANRELFGVELDTDAIRAHIRHALGAQTRDASVRVYVQEDPAGGQFVTVTVRPPVDMPEAAQHLVSVPYQRSIAHVKHTGDFGQGYYGRLAEREGYDEALLTAPDGVISEGSITNIGFFTDGEIVWPDAPMLAGITMQLLERHLPKAGLPSIRRRVRLDDLPGFTAAFVTNSRGIAPVRRIDDTVIPVDNGLMATLYATYASVPWDAFD
jgi:branched-subunit amino acid aminotransferase/4-amino-4-deoxychorismate lyase